MSALADNLYDPSLPVIRLNDHIAIFGMTGTGKSLVAHHFYNTVPEQKDKDGVPINWKIAIDISDSIVDYQSVTFFDPEKIPWDAGNRLRFVPNIETLDVDMNTLYGNILLQGNCWVWNDEINEVSTAHRTIFNVRKALLQGRKLQIGTCNVTPRPVDINKSIFTQAQHIIVFPLSDSDDRLRVAKNIGLSLDTFDEVMGSLEDYAYLWFVVRNRALYVMPPLPVEYVDYLEGLSRRVA